MQGFGQIFAVALLCFGAFLNSVVLVHLGLRTVLAYAARSKRKEASAIPALASIHQ